MREKYGVCDDWVLPFQVVPIIHIPDFGDTSAVKVCEDLKIKSQNDRAKLEEAKGLTYLKGFTDGVMIVGPYKGKKVSEAKPLLKEDLIKTGCATLYSEPEKEVISRSGDTCVVALTDKWYLIYGSRAWRTEAMRCLQGMELYHDETRAAFETVRNHI